MQQKYASQMNEKWNFQFQEDGVAIFPLFLLLHISKNNMHYVK